MTTELPARIKRLELTVGASRSGELLHESQYVYTYADDAAGQSGVSLLMPPTRLVYQDSELFPSMDMNMPEGYLFQRLLEMHPKQQLTKMHLLALIGSNGIGRVGFVLPQHAAAAAARPMSRAHILASAADERFFGELVNAYLSTGAGISGVQPKIMVPSRTTMPIPDLIVKAAGADYPGLAANEYLCMSAARHAGLLVPEFDLSVDGSIIVFDRFDVDSSGQRLGFEDIAALMALRVHDRLSQRKYHGSYESVAEVIRLMSSAPSEDLAAFYEQLALSVMVRNGDAHLKNFGMLYSTPQQVRLSPLFDVVTTAIYTMERPGNVEFVDRTLALKWRKGKRHASRAYPTTRELLEFGKEICGVSSPQQVIERIADAMAKTLAEAVHDERVPRTLLDPLREQWKIGMAYN
jgi:serine/threonine-protein kinase HipA